MWLVSRDSRDYSSALGETVKRLPLLSAVDPRRLAPPVCKNVEMTSLEKVRPATAADVAARAGVSRATVSHILSGREERFPEPTRARVRKAARELNYSPWASGRSLVRGRSDTIVVLLPQVSIGGMRLQETIETLTRSLTGPDANVVLRIADEDAGSTVSALLKLQPLAVVELGALPTKHKALLQSHGVAVVPDIEHPVRYHGMTIDVAIGDLQVQELGGRGDRQIVYAALHGDKNDAYGAGRWTALEGACSRRGLAAPLRMDVPLDVDGAAEQIKKFGRVPLGIAAYNDEVAAAVLSACTRLGKSVPEDISVIGVDNSQIARLWVPRITSVEADMSVFANVALGQLRAQLGGSEMPGPEMGNGMLRVVPGLTT